MNPDLSLFDPFIQDILPWLTVLWQAALALLAAALLYVIGSRVLRRLAAPNLLPRTLLQHALRPARWMLAVFALHLVLRGAADSLYGAAGLRQAMGLALILVLTWLALNCVRAVADVIISMNPADVADNLDARRIRTQANVLARAVMVLISIIGLSAGLMTFPDVRQFGASLLASAGAAGLVVGFAAKPVLGNLLAGLQIAMTQPFRLDDVVIVEGEWGRIEEIAGSYVVVRIWDERRLIVPLQWFIEHPFQNWTRTGSQILGTVSIWVDYRTTLEPLRAEAKRLCEAAPEWDQRLCLIQVTDANERAMQLRVLVSASDASLAWDLRCKLREGLIAFIARNAPESLPLIRAEVTGALLEKAA